MQSNNFTGMENLLVEKISVDFWRLRRTIRFEAGSISKHIENLLKSYYSDGKSNNVEIDRKIENMHSRIVWNTAYLKYLKQNEVIFSQPTWEGKAISSDILEDFRLIAQSLPNLTRAERNRLYEGDLTFDDLSTLLAQHGYSQDEHIATRLVEIYSGENRRLERELEELRQKKVLNQEEDARNAMIGSTPSEESMEKVLKYERSIQKSIFQNIFLLKKLQGLF